MEKENKERQETVAGLSIGSFVLFWVIFNFLTGLILAILVGITSNKVLKKRDTINKNRINMIIGSMFIVAIIMPIISAIRSDNETQEAKKVLDEEIEEQINNLTEETSEKSLEELIKDLAMRSISSNTNIKRVFIENDEVEIEYDARENLTNNLTLKGIHIDAEKITEAVSAILNNDTGINSINIMSYMNLVDQYGNMSSKMVSIITFKRETWEKINWENFINDNVPQVADYYWIHPALK